MALMLGVGGIWGAARRLFLLSAAAAAVAQGCQGPKEAVQKLPDTAVAPGVVLRQARVGGGAVRVIDVELGSRARVEIAAEDVRLRGGLVSGRARTLREWLRATGAVAGVNGGFFGRTVDPEHKEIVGLLK